MRQEIEVTATLTLDADATLTREELTVAVTDLLYTLHFPEVRDDPVELLHATVTGLRQEAEIYSDVSPEDIT